MRMLIEKINSYLKMRLLKFIQWLWEGKALYSILIIFIIVFCTPKEIIDFSQPENIRIFGLILQITGSFFILKSLINKLVLFKKHGLLAFFANYFKKCPLFKKPRTYSLSAKMAGEFKLNAEATVLRGSPKKSLEDLYIYFEERIENLESRFTKYQIETTNKIQEITQKLNMQNLENLKNIKEIKKLLETSQVSNVWSDLFGTASIIIGIIFSTIPQELAGLFF